jgi:hypothetical protein
MTISPPVVPCLPHGDPFAQEALPRNVGTFSILPTADAQQVAEYEHHFYQAYANLTGNTLVRQIWDWDDERQRLKTKIPYDEQVVYLWRDQHHRLLLALAVNVCSRSFQSEAFGFTPDDPDQRWCEILNVMSTEHLHPSTAATFATRMLQDRFRELVARGFAIAYATCTRRRLRPYLHLGAKLLKETTLNGEARFFLLWPMRELVQEGSGDS